MTMSMKMAGKERKKRRVPMEMELQTVGKIQVLGTGVAQNSPAAQNQATTNLDQISRVADQEVEAAPFHVDLNFVSLPAFLHNAERGYTKQDLKYNFAVSYFSVWTKMMPWSIETSGKNVPKYRVGHKVWWKDGICFGWFVLALIRLVILMFSTANLMLTAGDVEEELGRITLMILATISFTIILYSFFISVSQSLENAMLLDNQVYKYLEDEPEPEPEEKIKWKFGLGFQSHTPKELLNIYIPFFIFSLCGIVPVFSIVDPSFPILLVSLLPPSSRFSPGFFSVLLLDSVIITYFIVIIHVIFFLFFLMHRIQEEARLTLQSMEEENPQNNKARTAQNRDAELYKMWMTIERALKSLRLLHIWAQFFNLSFSTTAYSVKLGCLTASIFGGFGLIKMVEVENVPFATVFGLAFLEGVILYNISFGGAYEIPETVEEVKRKIRHMSHSIKLQSEAEAESEADVRNSNQNGNWNRNQHEIQNQSRNRNRNSTTVERKCMYTEKYLRSIPWLGVRDGVYKMERMTCANFLQFSVEQIADLILTY